MVHAGGPESDVVGVASVALGGRRDVRSRLAERRSTVMAGRTGTDSAGTMRIGSPRPRSGRTVASVALGRGDNVADRFGLGIGKGIAATMATRTVRRGNGTGCSGMVHGGWCKSCEIPVAGVTRRRRRNMIGRFAQRSGPVMACRTAAGSNARVVEGDRGPGRGGTVAGATLSRRCNVSCRLGLCVLGEIATTMAG